MKNCGIHELEEVLRGNKEGRVIDVREPAEFASEHIEGALSMPLSGLKEESVKELSKDKPVFLICQSGARACKAAEQLEKMGFSDLRVFEGGLKAWIQAGKNVFRGKSRVWSLDRQVRLAAGLLVGVGIVLSNTVHPNWIGLSAFVAAGLIFSGVTDTCGMAMILARMPWNKIRA